MPPTAYEVYKELEREDRFAPHAGSTQDSSYTTWRERAATRNLRRGLAIIIACWMFYFLYLNRLYAASIARSFSNKQEELTSGTVKIPLEAHIMSKCPDAQDCLQQLVVPAMERISDKVDFDLSFIGSISKQTSDVECKHGPTECIGNMIILCAANLPFPPNSHGSSTSRTPVIRSLGFANCLIGDYEQIPSRSLVESCALEHGIDFDALNECASRQDDGLNDPEDPTPDDPTGIALLRKSVQHSADLGVTKSCTVRLDEKVWCIRDNGEWADCPGGSGDVSALVGEVERLWAQRNQ
ncbi:hypothetical protein BGW36DRAFT_321685 [Talaromyces proteolyticus]|uniref:Gamma interferon inducible lysosomal thiol reductase GILT n=1 Tax=Talaromyces proteolyticus TaxID=1131652 RepID=A0AAD4Q024_9EURO|nr:uncharacterized protein BGW36DRAFT_321685 [Talaromyces proteolyticus]KAH8696458.1 hypothetical protein BGW36DRAFT_321685 [Talaromyces proteolyticus]